MAQSTPGISAISKMTNEELKRLGIEEILYLLRKSENERMQLLAEHNNLMKDINKKMQVHLLEIRGLKEVNQRMQQDNQELRDLCCFLDDDRQKRSKIAREWQRFGRYTSGVIKSEVSVYQEKLKELETQQENLLKENIELKQLCILLDKERENETKNNLGLPTFIENSETSNQQLGKTEQNGQGGVIGEKTLKYIRRLEEKLMELEPPKMKIVVDQSASSIQQKQASLVKPAAFPNDQQHRKFFSTPQLSHGMRRASFDDLLSTNPRSMVVKEDVQESQDDSAHHTSISKPEAVVHAMKVLEVHEKINQTSDINYEELDEPKKALLEELCNVVWRKLEEDPAEGEAT